MPTGFCDSKLERRVGSSKIHSGKLIQQQLGALTADVICLTQGPPVNLPTGGQAIQADADYGYSAAPERSKVLLWKAIRCQFAIGRIALERRPLLTFP